MFDTFPRYDVLKNTAIYFCNVNIYYIIDLWTSPTYSCCLAMQDVPLLCAWLTTYPKHGPCMILQRNLKTRLYLRDNLWLFLSSSVGAPRLRASGGYYAASLLSWPRSANLQKALRQELEMWMENGKNKKIKDEFKAKRSTTHHTLITRCPPSQPLCNLWTSLLDFYVRWACAVTFCTCTCSERRSSYPDVFSSTQGAGGASPCVPEAHAAVRQHRSFQPERILFVAIWNARFSTSLVGDSSL